MSKEVLGIIDNAMKSIGLEYGFGEYGGNSKGEIVYPYWVGSYTETESYTEDGLQESTVMITGFSRGSWLDLENGKAKSTSTGYPAKWASQAAAMPLLFFMLAL